MITLIFSVYEKLENGYERTNQYYSKFKCRAEAEDVMHSMECGVYDQEDKRYVPEKIVYELEEA